MYNIKYNMFYSHRVRPVFGSTQERSGRRTGKEEKGCDGVEDYVGVSILLYCIVIYYI